MSPVTVGTDRLPRDGRFVRPELAGRVAFREHPSGGASATPAWKGLRHQL